MAHVSRLILAAAAGISLVASCTTESATEFHGEAGASIDGGFGNSTMNNTLVMTGQGGYVLDLANRFAAEVDSTVNFAFNSATLDGEAQAVLLRQANWIRQFPEVRFRVYGHTDLVGSSAYNQRLGLRRAQAVVHFLVSHGISRTRLEAVVSKGETQPLIVTQGRERQNRRTVTEVTGFVANSKLILDGKYAQVVYRNYVDSAIPATGLSGTELTASGSSGG
ncbi:membrane protein [Primorskyibacter flagellatus]|uniref:Membrane protein n=1 Tax=Primorskyibacter flagellatus TaxID=1387277 RepID=A0A917A7P7_9RHOB|nr:OmpA family protein [Primorskyibacter flagellatus]GGE33808.1 membrane protein [Primorskyibacter flagellatus]